MMPKLLLLFCGVLAATGACASRPVEPAAEHAGISTGKLAPASCGSIEHLHTLGGVFLASQPSATDFEQARGMGVKTIVNLRHASELTEFDERSVVEGLGLTYVHLPWQGPEGLNDGIFDRAREILKTAERPLLLHCASANRVGAVWLPYRALDEGLSFEDALAEAETVGLKSAEFQTKARDYVARCAREQR